MQYASLSQIFATFRADMLREKQRYNEVVSNTSILRQQDMAAYNNVQITLW